MSNFIDENNNDSNNMNINVPLIYNNDVNCSNFKNIILIHDEVQDYNNFIESSNLNSFPIVYNSSSSREELKTLLKDKFLNIERISLVFHNATIDRLTNFFDNEALFTNNDLIENTYSNNLQFIIDLVKDFNVKNLDYLACNTLQYEHWKKYYNIIYKETNVIVGASNDLTGNIKYGGDWILENTNEDIKNIYFTDTIEQYQYVLATTEITQSGENIYIRQNTSTSNIQYSTDNNTWNTIIWPLQISNTSNSNILTVLVNTDITFSPTIGNTNGYFIINSKNITINGNNKIITINEIKGYEGLIQNGTYVNGGTKLKDGYTNINIQNFGIVSSNDSSLASNAGWICQGYFGKSISSGTITVSNCYSNGTGTVGKNCGFILGANIGRFSTGGTIIAENCYSTGITNFDYDNIGGIFGYNAMNNTIAKNCYSSITIYSGFSGGIFGSYSSGTANNCYFIGTVNRGDMGGIFGSSSTGTANNCYFNGVISNTNINHFNTFGAIFATGSSGIANNCYSNYSSIKLFNNSIGGTANYCYCNNNIIGDGTITINNCYSYDNNWSDTTAISKIKVNDTTPSKWIDYSSESNVPWLLSSFNDDIYASTTQDLTYGTSGTSSNGLFTGSYSIISTTPSTPSISINTTTGKLTFPNTLSTGTYTINVLSFTENSNVDVYNTNNYVLNVTKANQNITFGALSAKTYGDQSFRLNADSDSGLPITYTSNNTSIATIIGNSVTIVGVGTVSITANQVGNSNYNSATLSQNLIVNKADQNITFDELSEKTFGDIFTLSASSSAGLPITYTSLNTSIATIIGNSVTIVGVGTVSITANQDGNSNYNSATLSQNLIVNKADQNITFNELSAKTFGNQPFTLNAISDSGLPITYESLNTSIATIIGNSVTIVGSGTVSITANQVGNSNYNSATQISQNLIVTKANQNITFNTIENKTYGDIFTLNAISDSGLPITYESSDILIATIIGNSVTIVGIGTVSISAIQNGDSIYNSATLSQNLIFTKANQNITFNTIENKRYEDSFTLNAISNSGLPITYASSNNSIATISGNSVTIVGIDEGNVSITASQPGNDFYNSASDVTRTFRVNTFICFKEDTKILTINGYIPIQNLRKGHLIKTLTQGYKSINMICKTKIYHNALKERNKDQLYKCTKETYPEILEDLVITGSHCILINKFKNKKQLEDTLKIHGMIFITENKYRLPVCVDDRSEVYEKKGLYTIYHLALDNDNDYLNYGIYANGLLVETCSKIQLKELSNMTLIK